jgi:hypothetical protein
VVSRDKSWGRTEIDRGLASAVVIEVEAGLAVVVIHRPTHQDVEARAAASSEMNKSPKLSKQPFWLVLVKPSALAKNQVAGVVTKAKES